MRIGLLGMGTIGSGVYEIVAKRTDMEIARVLDLRRIPGLGGKLTTRFEDILEDGLFFLDDDGSICAQTANM